MTTLPSTRSEALRTGSRRYFTGKPCKHGHLAERQAADGCCIVCRDLKVKSWQQDNPEKSRAKSAAWKNRNKEAIRQRAAAQYASDPEKFRAIALESYYRHRSKRLAASRAWKEANKDSVLEYARKYSKANMERRSASQRTRHARAYKSDGSHSADDVLRLLQMQRHKCAACAKALNGRYHVDHVMPLYLGGSNRKDNLQILCPTCNMKKGKKDPIKWAQENGRLL